MRSLCRVALLAIILSISGVQLCSSARLLDETPNGLPANLPANLPADSQANLPADLPADVSPEMLNELPPEMLAKLPPDGTEMLAKIPLSKLPPNITPEMLARIAEKRKELHHQQQQQGQPGGSEDNAAGVAAADIPQIPKMPDFSGLADLSFPPMPSATLPKMPQNISLFGYDVEIPKFINKLVDEHT